MVRTQVQLTEEQFRRLKRLAADRGVSIASLVREAVDRHLTGTEEEARWDRFFAVVGRFRSGRRDVGEGHDRYLADDFLA
ncbi:MAG: CopG family transcriptional regulator [Actinomycetota bacterium]